MEPVSVLRVISPYRLVLGLASGAVISAWLDAPLDTREFSGGGSVSPIQPLSGWARLGRYDLEERAFRGSLVVLDRVLHEAVTTPYRRVDPCY